MQEIVAYRQKETLGCAAENKDRSFENPAHFAIVGRPSVGKVIGINRAAETIDKPPLQFVFGF